MVHLGHVRNKPDDAARVIPSLSDHKMSLTKLAFREIPVAVSKMDEYESPTKSVETTASSV